MILNPDELGAPALYKILLGSVVPRPIGWTSTLSGDGVANLAPFSFFTVVSRKPPMISLTLMPRSERASPKDTLANIRETGEFVVNMVSFAQVNQMHQSAGEYPAETDEFDALHLRKAASEIVKPPRVDGAPISLECKLDRLIPLGDVGDTLVIGRVVRIHLRDDVWQPQSGRIDTAAFQPVGRMAAEYTLAESLFICPIDEALIVRKSGERGVRIDL